MQRNIYISNLDQPLSHHIAQFFRQDHLEVTPSTRIIGSLSSKATKPEWIYAAIDVLLMWLSLKSRLIWHAELSLTAILSFWTSEHHLTKHKPSLDVYILSSSFDTAGRYDPSNSQSHRPVLPADLVRPQRLPHSPYPRRSRGHAGLCSWLNSMATSLTSRRWLS